jgi:hypothetical protein
LIYFGESGQVLDQGSYMMHLRLEKLQALYDLLHIRQLPCDAAGRPSQNPATIPSARLEDSFRCEHSIQLRQDFGAQSGVMQAMRMPMRSLPLGQNASQFVSNTFAADLMDLGSHRHARHSTVAGSIV